jgi:integrase
MGAGVPKEPESFPFVLTRKNGRATIYRSERRKGDKVYFEFRVASYDTDGKRILQSFSSFEDAFKSADARVEALGRGLVDVTTLSGPARLDYLKARNLLPPAVTLTEAVQVWQRTQEGPKAKPATIRELVTAFIASREAGTRRGKAASHAYTRDLRGRLGKLADAFNVDVRDVTAQSLEDWLQATGQTGRNRFNTLRMVRTLLKWAQKRGNLLPGPIATDTLDIVTPADDGAIEIFSPEELAKLLRAAKSEMIPYLALGAFAGLRTAETARLDWSAVKLEREFIEVGADKAKTASRRLVPIVPALAAWLDPIRKPLGPVLPYANVAKQVGWLARDAGVTWKHNALRHSFISYRLAAIQNVDKVALEAGNSPAMIFRHYRELVTPAQAAAWFSVIPDAPSIGMPTAPLEAAG